MTGLVLANGTDTLAVPTGATTFTMPTPVAFGSSYQVVVKTQPTGMSCSVNPATASTMPASSVTFIVVTCSTGPYALGGTVTINGPTGVSLSDQGLAIKNTSNGDTYTFATNAGSFTMPMPLAFGAAYALTVTTQPTGLICAIANPTGTMPAAAVNLAVTCSDQAYTLSGNVTINSPNGVTGCPTRVWCSRIRPRRHLHVYKQRGDLRHASARPLWQPLCALSHDTANGPELLRQRPLHDDAGRQCHHDCSELCG